MVDIPIITPGNFQMPNICTQCGFIHPPLTAGQKCPLLKEKTSSGEVIDPSDFLLQMKNIIVSKIQARNIKEPKKVFSRVLIEITKILDQYKEE
jgi:hypothetical protein